MANIMMTDVCNLKCPYCFANEFVNKDKNEISEEAFDKAVEFIVGDGTHSTVGLIGGEPTIHSNFEYLLRKLIRNPKVNKIVIYTNGIQIDRYWNLITHKKVHLLINCNSPADIGQNNFTKLCNNLSHLLETMEFRENTSLGINMYNPDFKFDYMLKLLEKYNMKRVRVSITVPNLEASRNCDAHAYFQSMKPRMFEFFHALLSCNIVPYFDCNKIPSCLIEKDELSAFSKYLSCPEIKENYTHSNISNCRVQCCPVIDIRQDLTAVRCFGLSEISKQRITDFSGIQDLQNYYLRTIDAFAYNTVYSDKCIDCYLRKTMICTGGCLAFKINRILKLQKNADELLLTGQ